MVSTRVLLSSPYFWGVLTLLAAVAIIAGSAWLLNCCYKLILPEDYSALKYKFGAPLKSMDIMIKRVPLPEPVRFWGNCYIHLTAPATGKVDIFEDKIVFSAQNSALVINKNDPDFSKKVHMDPPFVTVSDFKGELPQNGVPVGLEIVLTEELNESIKNKWEIITMSKTAIIIPARYGSSRLEGKPLLKVADKPVIQWVYEKAQQAKLADMIIVATDDERIFNAVTAFGGVAEMTSKDHKCGSDRIREVVDRHPEISYIVNLQGDEPLIEPSAIDEVAKNVQEDVNADISTLVRVLKDEEEINNPNLVKCVRDKNGFALYFSRSKIPYERNTISGEFYGHLGIYGYKRSALIKMTSLEQTPLEKTESLEQLRALENGMKIKTSVVDFVPVGIDTAQDLEKFKAIISRKLAV